MLAKLILVSSLFSSAAASAWTCYDHAGTSAKVEISGNYLEFETGKTGLVQLKYDGQSSSAYYYRKDKYSEYEQLVVLKKSVVSTGVGKVSYRYKEDAGGDHPVERIMVFKCK